MKLDRLEKAQEINEILLNIVLEDNAEMHGGTAFLGETLRDFLEETGEDTDDVYGRMEIINKMLNDCGIQQIDITRYMFAEE